jgi:hypothetical protein
VNLLYALETVELLLIAGVATEPGKDNNRQANQTAFAQVCLLQRRKLNYYLYCFFFLQTCLLMFIILDLAEKDFGPFIIAGG